MRRRLVVLLVLMVCLPSVAGADDPWIEVKSPNFIVVSNAGDGRARNIAWQFEQIRAAIQIGWPWARVQLDRPVIGLDRGWTPADGLGIMLSSP